jgi:hypothetical protein
MTWNKTTDTARRTPLRRSNAAGEDPPRADDREIAALLKSLFERWKNEDKEFLKAYGCLFDSLRFGSSNRRYPGSLGETRKERT